MIIWKSLLFDEGLEFTHKTTVHMLNEGIFHDTLPCLPITFPKPCPPTPLHCFAFTKAIRVSRNFVHLPCQMLISPNIKMRDVSLFPVRKGRKETLRQSSDVASWYNLSEFYQCSMVFTMVADADPVGPLRLCYPNSTYLWECFFD